MKTLILTFALVLLSLTSVAAQKISAPTLTSIPISESQKRLMDEGIALHDRGDFDGAIAKYEEVLKQNPNSDWAYYEMAFAYQMKGDFKKSLEIAYKGAQYKSDKVAGFYMLIGNDLDDLGESKKAVEAYRAAIKIEPHNHLIYYNLALTYSRLGDLDEAKKNLKQAVFLNPDHASSHVVLAQVFRKTNFTTPALFAAMRFLVIEPSSRRSPGAYKIFSEILRGGATAGKNPNEINIALNLGGSKEEGDFGFLELTLGLGAAMMSSEKSKGKSEGQLLVEQLNTLLAIVSEADPKDDKGKFTWKYYIPYFAELKKKNYVEPFAYYISQGSNLKGVNEWLQANPAKVNEFLSWSKGYQWPKE